MPTLTNGARTIRMVSNMINYGKQFGFVAPQEIEITNTAVFIASDIQQQSRKVEDYTITGYEYNLVQYSKDEYLMKQADSITAL